MMRSTALLLTSVLLITQSIEPQSAQAKGTHGASAPDHTISCVDDHEFAYVVDSSTLTVLLLLRYGQALKDLSIVPENAKIRFEDDLHAIVTMYSRGCAIDQYTVDRRTLWYLLQYCIGYLA